MVERIPITFLISLLIIFELAIMFNHDGHVVKDIMAQVASMEDSVRDLRMHLRLLECTLRAIAGAPVKE